ncbi:galactokinase [Ornithinimicrobium pratense]|uniref:Galactokinase n=1 Tax=Ornithinimicrobium pratense TaxID=2593973 RepID=A0A5J6V4L8_9MICO|nr:galactokinase [Ornithinimicrobium pratense]QFG68537.1 galactokinase [Ornithinimicrobium pratense]
MTGQGSVGLSWLAPAQDELVVAQLGEAAQTLFGHAPDGVWMAPGRVNLIGEHTDYNSGLSLPFALPHRTYAAVRRRRDGVLRIASVQKGGIGWAGRVEQVRTVAEAGKLGAGEAGRPAGAEEQAGVTDSRSGSPVGWPAYVAGVFAALTEQVGADELGADVLIDGRVPLGAGLSSSAALSCSVAVALRDLVPGLRNLEDADLVAACIRAENDYAGAATGGMDQTISVRAREEHLLLIDSGDGSLTPVPWTLPDHRVLVVDTRAHHSLGDGQYAARRHTCEAAAAALGVGSLSELEAARLDEAEVIAVLGAVPDGLPRVRHVVSENQRVIDLLAALDARDTAQVGALMTASHVSLREDYEVSCRELDVAVGAALAAGAAGARMTGGGFGGSAIALVRGTELNRVAGAVHAAFVAAGLEEPRFLVAEPSRPAGRVSG